ncbi:MAG: leucine-rich repeat protein, partial [Eubacterium sp.]|nr:leucine-rich repeat protein [Eubacterium sp.]
KLRRIGKKAFFNCKSMKSMKLTSVKLKKVGSGAFKNAGKKSYKKFKISVPKAKKKAYAKLLKKGGLNKKSKVK